MLSACNRHPGFSAFPLYLHSAHFVGGQKAVQVEVAIMNGQKIDGLACQQLQVLSNGRLAAFAPLNQAPAHVFDWGSALLADPLKEHLADADVGTVQIVHELVAHVFLRKHPPSTERDGEGPGLLGGMGIMTVAAVIIHKKNTFASNNS